MIAKIINHPVCLRHPPLCRAILRSTLRASAKALLKIGCPANFFSGGEYQRRIRPLQKLLLKKWVREYFTDAKN
jgi:hypothetical protein